MNPIFPELPRQLGVYTLTRLIELRKNTALYEAQQTHVDRAVVLEVLAPGVSHAEEVTFLAQARLRVASSELPHVANVYESLRAEGLWFLTQELPLGRSLAEIAAAGEQLSVPLICCIINAAAEMYDLCSQVDLKAMPLAPSSIFIEEGGEVHFLSPLVEGEPNEPDKQMQALSMALWAVCPQDKAPGLGRVTTLLQWLNEGYEGQWLHWATIGATASTILEQLAEAARMALERSLSYRLAHNPVLVKIRQFVTRWAKYIIAYTTIIVALSSLGTFFGMADPVHTSAGNKKGFLCRQFGQDMLVMRNPVSISEYEDFIIQYEEMDDAEREEMLDSIPGEIGHIEPRNWEEQLDSKSHSKPVTGVSYWQAFLYAHFKGGHVPTANQLQAIRAAGVKLHDLEWSCTEVTDSLPQVYDSETFLLIDANGNPFPTNHRNWNSERCSFRIAIPETK